MNYIESIFHSIMYLISKFTLYKQERFTEKYTDEKRINRLESFFIILIPEFEKLKKEVTAIYRENIVLRNNNERMTRECKEAIDALETYKRIAKEKAIRTRKHAAPDHSGYVCTGCREIQDRYDYEDDSGHIIALPVAAYRTTVSMPYPSALGFDELRQLIEIDLVGNGYNHILNYDGWDGLGYRLGMDRIIEGCPADGKHPGKEQRNTAAPVCVLYRVTFNLYKEYAEADLYTTAPLYLWNDPYKPIKEKGRAE